MKTNNTSNKKVDFCLFETAIIIISDDKKKLRANAVHAIHTTWVDKLPRARGGTTKSCPKLSATQNYAATHTRVSEHTYFYIQHGPIYIAIAIERC